MKNSGATFITLFVIAGLVTAGYFLLQSFSDPADYITNDYEKIGDLRPMESGNPSGTPTIPDVVVDTPTEPDPEPKPTVSMDANADLIADIQKLVDAKTTIKIGAKGASVGTIQKFMNLYFKKNSKIDNDFGKVLEANVKTFQSQNKITSTGQVASQTLSKMIEWLNNN